MLKKLSLKQFKAFERADLQIAPITLVTGPNSSGKTAILSALAMVMQSRSPHAFPFELSANGSNVKLGAFGDILRKNRKERSFAVELSFDVHRENPVRFKADYRRSDRGEGIECARLEFAGSDGAELILERDGSATRARFSHPGFVKLVSSDQVLGAFRNFALTLTKQIDRTSGSRKQASGKSEADDDPLLSQLSEYLSDPEAARTRWHSLEAKHLDEALAQLAKNPVAQAVLSEIDQAVKLLASTSTYVGPVRAHPSRYYLVRESSRWVDPLGENVFALLAEWSTRSPRKLDAVINALRTIGVASKIETRALFGNILRLSVSPHSPERAFSIADVGFGVSQILPVVVADESLPPGGLLVVNQPEVHLHPASQAALADYFSSRLEHRQYIVETHSEYLINRLRLRIAQGSLDPDMVSIIFVDPPNKARSYSKAVRIAVDRDGSLTKAPKSFFKTYYEDAFEMAATLMR